MAGVMRVRNDVWFVGSDGVSPRADDCGEALESICGEGAAGPAVFVGIQADVHR